MEKRQQLYEGKAKIIYATDDADLVIQHFKDDATAFNAQKKGTIVNKGVFNNHISSICFQLLEEHGVATHFVKQINDRDMLVKRLQIVPLEVVVRNVVAGSLAQRMGLEEGSELGETIVEFYYKRDDLGDPLLNADHIRAFGLANDQEVAELRSQGLKVNTILRRFFDERGIMLVDFKLEFGRHHGALLLGDEITPDGCRLWDKATRKKLDKDRFRRDLGGIEEAYAEIERRVAG